MSSNELSKNNIMLSLISLICKQILYKYFFSLINSFFYKIKYLKYSYCNL